LKEIQNKRLF